MVAARRCEHEMRIKQYIEMRIKQYTKYNNLPSGMCVCSHTSSQKTSFMSGTRPGGADCTRTFASRRQRTAKASRCAISMWSITGTASDRVLHQADIR
jgi:hypothetical protein